MREFSPEQARDADHVGDHQGYGSDGVDDVLTSSISFMALVATDGMGFDRRMRLCCRC